MTDTPEPDSLAHVFLRRLDAKFDRMAETLADHGHRLNHIDAGIAAIRRDQAADAEGVAHLEARIDRLQGEIDRINRRLDIAD